MQCDCCIIFARADTAFICYYLRAPWVERFGIAAKCKKDSKVQTYSSFVSIKMNSFYVYLDLTIFYKVNIGTQRHTS